jgi:hypothetical protein
MENFTAPSAAGSFQVSRLSRRFPCTVSPETPFDEDVQISVWNCSPTVYYKDKDVEEWPLTEPEKDRLYDLAVESVEQAGGAINISGWYPPNEALCKYIAELKQRYGRE